MKAGLKLIIEGTTYRKAAQEVGLASHQDLHRAAKKLGLLDFHTEQLIIGYKRLVALSNRELERRLTEDPGSIGTRDLTILSGVAADKTGRYESWGQRDPGDPGELAASLGHLMDRISKATLTIETSEPLNRAIDVTPRQESDR